MEDALDVIGRRLVLLFDHTNTGGFLLKLWKVESEILAVLIIYLELHLSPLEFLEEQPIQPVRNKRKQKQILIG
jgi:hypothetical protein